MMTETPVNSMSTQDINKMLDEMYPLYTEHITKLNENETRVSNFSALNEALKYALHLLHKECDEDNVPDEIAEIYEHVTISAIQASEMLAQRREAQLAYEAECDGFDRAYRALEREHDRRWAEELKNI